MQIPDQEEESLGLESVALLLGTMMALHGVALICLGVEVARGRRQHRSSSKIIEAIKWN